MIHVIYDLLHHDRMQKIGTWLRELYPDQVQEVWAEKNQSPVGDIESPIDQVWYAGQICSKLADCYSGGLIQEQDTLIHSSYDAIITTAINRLSLICQVTVLVDDLDFDNLKEKLRHA